MGTFDSFLAPCPDCGSPLEFQTKARYDGTGGDFAYFAIDLNIAPSPFHRTILYGIPLWLAEDLIGDEQTCHPCGRRVKLNGSLQPERMLDRGRKDDLVTP